MPYTRTRNIYHPKVDTPYKLSRSKIELFFDCPRCLYLDRRLGVGRPSGPPFNLNIAVDTLLKQEFDIHRSREETHPLLAEYGVDARPVGHSELDAWRENFKGIQALHETTNFLVTGAIDDLWINNKTGEYIVVDYKATAKAEPVTELNSTWHKSYKRQMEIYQWLLRQKKMKVSDTGYFVYCTGKTDVKAFDGKLEFAVHLIPYEGKANWIDKTLGEIKKMLDTDSAPEAGERCDYCPYREAANEAFAGPAQKGLGI